MKLPRVTAPSNTLQALFNLITNLWSRFFGDRMDPVALPAELAGLRVEAGTRKWVTALRCNFVYDPTCALAADGITVIASTVAGRWVRQPTDPYAWGAQSAFVIDSAHPAASDLNPGTDAMPLRTLGELGRRLPRGSQVDCLVDIVNVEATDTLPSLTCDQHGRLLLRGRLSASNRLEAGVLSGYAARNPANNTPATITKAAGDWTSLIGKLIYFPARNSWSWIGKDLTGGAAAILVPIAYSDAWAYFGTMAGAAVPQPGDAYEVYEPPTVSLPDWYNEARYVGYNANVSADALMFSQLVLRAGAAAGGYVALSAPEEVVFRCCAFGRAQEVFEARNAPVILTTCCIGSTNRTFDYVLDVGPGSMLNNVLYLGGTGTRLTVQKGRLNISTGGILCINGYVTVYIAATLNNVDWIASIGGAYVLQIRERGYVDAHGGGGIFGSGITTNVLSISPTGTYVGAAANKLYGTTTGGDQLSVGGTLDHLPNIIAAAGLVLPAAAPCRTFAQLFGAAPSFDGTCFDYKTGAYIGP